MEYIRDITEYTAAVPSAVTLGKFDGVHRGHRKLISRVCTLAKERNCRAAVFTFQVSPQAALGEAGQKVLTTNAERAEILEDLGIGLLVECPFTPALRNMEAEDFVRRILVGHLKTGAVVVGTDFHFGRNRQGNPEFLREMGKKYGFSVDVLEKEKLGTREISSTYVREELSLGHMEKVEELLGYPYCISGRIVHGRHLGHTLGFPTINQIPEEKKMLPPYGVYYSKTFVEDRWYSGISNIGVKPTVGGKQPDIETYLFDCDADLYGLEARVELLTYRRPEKKFPSVEALQTEMRRDIAAGKAFFNS